MTLPNLDVVGDRCEHCGEETQLTDAPFCCAMCDDRQKRERLIESGNEYRRQAQVRLDLAVVRQRVRRYLRGEKS